MLFKEIRKIEQSLRTIISNLVGEKDMVTFYLDDNMLTSCLKENYCISNGKNERFISEELFNKNVAKLLYNDIKKTKAEPAIKHYINNYNGIIPIWVAINYISFGTLLKLIDSLTTIKLNEFMKGKPFRKVKDKNDPSSVDLKSIQILRNKISHHSNILGKQSPYVIHGEIKSIYFSGYNAICRWFKFLYDDDPTVRLLNEMSDEINKINEIYNTAFDFSIISNKKIR